MRAHAMSHWMNMRTKKNKWQVETDRAREGIADDAGAKVGWAMWLKIFHRIGFQVCSREKLPWCVFRHAITLIRCTYTHTQKSRICFCVRCTLRSSAQQKWAEIKWMLSIPLHIITDVGLLHKHSRTKLKCVPDIRVHNLHHQWK